MEVVKRDGRRETFDREKVRRACVGCGAPEEVATRIAEEVEKEARNGMATSEVKDMVLQKLDAENSQFRSNWEEYQRTKATS